MAGTLDCSGCICALACGHGKHCHKLPSFYSHSRIATAQTKDQFDMTAAQLVVNNTDPELARSKAQLLQELLPHRFRQNWAENFRQERYCLPAFDHRMTFAKLAIEHSDRRKALVRFGYKCTASRSEPLFRNG